MFGFTLVGPNHSDMLVFITGNSGFVLDYVIPFLTLLVLSRRNRRAYFFDPFPIMWQVTAATCLCQPIAKFEPSATSSMYFDVLSFKDNLDRSGAFPGKQLWLTPCKCLYFIKVP